MRHFTVEEANELLPTLTQVLEHLQALAGRLRTAMQEVHRFELRSAQNGHSQKVMPFETDHDLNAIRVDMEQRLEYLHGLGVHLKDIETGILDFPTRMHGHDVYLCWRLGEERVQHWHEIDSGFAGRRPLI